MLKNMIYYILYVFKRENLNVENMLTKKREMILANLHKPAQNKKSRFQSGKRKERLLLTARARCYNSRTDKRGEGGS